MEDGDYFGKDELEKLFSKLDDYTRVEHSSDWT